MNKAAFLFVLVLLLALAVPLCIARGPQGPRTDEFIDAPYTTIPPGGTGDRGHARGRTVGEPGEVRGDPADRRRDGHPGQGDLAGGQGGAVRGTAGRGRGRVQPYAVPGVPRHAG